MSGTREATVEALQELGLTEYEARCYVALVRLGDSPAAEIASTAQIPRTRVYDVTDRLSDRGLVEVRPGNPRQFRAVEPELVRSRLERAYTESLETAMEFLEDPPSPEYPPEGTLYFLRSQDQIVDRAEGLLGNAQEEVYLWIEDEDWLPSTCFEWLRTRTDRGVDVHVIASDHAIRDRFEQAVPRAHVRPPAVPLEGDGQDGFTALLMCDRSSVLLVGSGEELSGYYTTDPWCVLTSLCRGVIGPVLDRSTEDPGVIDAISEALSGAD